MLIKNIYDFRESIQDTIQAVEDYHNGLPIEYAGLGGENWQPCVTPTFIISSFKYRPIQKKPLTQKQAGALVETVLINNGVIDCRPRYVVVQTTDSGLWVKGLQLYSSTLHISYETLMNGFWESKEGIKLWH